MCAILPPRDPYLPRDSHPPRDLYPPEGFPLKSLENVKDAFTAIQASTYDSRAETLKECCSGIRSMCHEATRLDAEWETIERRGSTVLAPKALKKQDRDHLTAMMEHLYATYPVLRQCVNDWPLIAFFSIKIEDIRKNAGRPSKANKNGRGLRPLHQNILSASSSIGSSGQETDTTTQSSISSSRSRSPRSVLQENLLTASKISKTSKTSAISSDPPMPRAYSESANSNYGLRTTGPESGERAMVDIALGLSPKISRFPTHARSKSPIPSPSKSSASEAAAAAAPALNSQLSDNDNDDEPPIRNSGRPKRDRKESEKLRTNGDKAATTDKRQVKRKDIEQREVRRQRKHARQEENEIARMNLAKVAPVVHTMELASDEEWVVVAEPYTSEHAPLTFPMFKRKKLTTL